MSIAGYSVESVIIVLVFVLKYQWYGVLCEVDLSICEEVFPCQNNGTCMVDTRNRTGTGFICSCVPGFAGYQCEIDISVCNTTENVCQNGGKCVDGVGNRFRCECEPGWSGETCHIDIDECESQPCQNGGICVNKINDFSCACPFGFTGRACETKLRICEENPCLNGAFCLNEQDDESKKTCYCIPDYHGSLCEFRYDDCDPPPKCFNGGSCIDGVGEFTCSCRAPYFGATCRCTDDNMTDPECANASFPTWPPFSDTALLPSFTPTPSIPFVIPTPTDFLPFSSETPIQPAVSTPGDIPVLSESGEIVATSAIPLPSSSPYDPGGGRNDLDQSSQIIEPEQSGTVFPTQIVTLSVPLSTPTLGQPAVSSDIVYEPSPTVKLDGSEGVLVTESLGQSSTLPRLETPLLMSSDQINVTPSESIAIESDTSAMIPLSPVVIESSAYQDYSIQGTPKVTDFQVTPSPSFSPELSITISTVSVIVDVPSGSVTYPHGVHTADMTADLPYYSTPVVDIETDIIISLSPSSSNPLLQPTATLLEPTSSEIESLVSRPEQSLPFVTLLPSPSEGGSILDITPSPTMSSLVSPTTSIDATPMLPDPSLAASSSLEGDSSASVGVDIPFPSLIEPTLSGMVTTGIPDSITPEPTSLVSQPSDYDPATTPYPAPSMTPTPPQITSTPDLPPPAATTTTTQQPNNFSDSCTDYCHNNAKCIADSIEPICLCSYKFTGNRCETLKPKFKAASFTGDSFLSFRVPNESIISKVDIRTKLVTIVPDGILLYTGVGRMYALIFTQSGHVTLHFSCGSQSMHFVETRMRVDNGFNFTLEFRMEMIVQGVNELRCSAEVSVNQSYVMKGEQVIGRDGVRLAAERPIEVVYLGGVAPFHTDASLNDDLVGILPGFRGCLHSLMINQEEKDIYEDALDGKDVAECTSFGCVANPCYGSARCVTTHAFPFWECICPAGYEGRRCQIIVCSDNPCKNGATCTYAQEESLNDMLNATIEDDAPRSVDINELATMSPASLRPVCLCRLGYSGAVCQHKINVTKPAFQPRAAYSAFIAYDPIPKFIDWFQLKFHFVTKNISQISLLLYSGNDRGPQPLTAPIGNHHHHEKGMLLTSSATPTAASFNNHMGFDQLMADTHPEPVSDFFAITFLQGFVALTWNLGSGTQRITTPSRIDNRLNIHTLFAGRSGRQAWLKVDGMRNVTGKTPGPLYRLNLDSNELYIGGYKSYKFEGLPHDLPLHQGFQGCIFDLGFRVKNRLYLPRAVRGRNVKNCFEEDC